MSPDEEKQLIERAQQGDREAQTLLIMQHRRALCCIAGSVKARGLDFDDRFQLACIFFLQSVARFDLRRDTRLSTWTYVYVRRALFKEAQINGIVRLPSHISKKRRTEKTEAAFHHAMNCFSFERLTEKDDTLVPTRIDDWLTAGEDREYRQRVHSQIAEAFKFLTSRERDVIRRRIRGETLGSVGRAFGITKERVRQIEQSAYNRLRYQLTGILDDDVLTRYNAAP